VIWDIAVQGRLISSQLRACPGSLGGKFTDVLLESAVRLLRLRVARDYSSKTSRLSRP
jgi:hypothetical protein